MRRFMLFTTLAAIAVVAAGTSAHAQNYGSSMMGNDQTYDNREDCGQGSGMMNKRNSQTTGQGQVGNPDQNQGQSRGYGPGYHMRGSGNGYGPNMMQGNGYGPNMMQGNGYGASMMQGNGYGPNMMQGNGYGASMMQGNGYGPSMMPGNGYGSNMMRGNGYGPGMRQGNGNDGRGNVQGNQKLNLTTDDVKSRVERWLVQQGNQRLKVGDVKENDADTISADVVTKDDSLVDRFIVNRHTGAVQQDKS